jgi:Tol biopolymer transport system component
VIGRALLTAALMLPICAALTTAAIALGGAAGGWIVTFTRWENNGEWTLHALMVERGLSARLYPALSFPNRPSPSPDGRFVLYADRTHLRLFLIDLDTGERYTLRAGGIEPVWSPDGRYFAAYFEDRVRVWALNTLPPTVIETRQISALAIDWSAAWSPGGSALVWQISYAEAVSVPTARETLFYRVQDAFMQPLAAGITGELAWSPDGSHLADTGAIYRITPDGQVSLITAFTPGLSAAAWSPDGSALAFTTHADNRAALAIVDAASGEAHYLPVSSVSLGPPIWSPEGTRVLFGASDDGQLYTLDLRSGRYRYRVLTDSGIYNWPFP